MNISSRSLHWLAVLLILGAAGVIGSGFVAAGPPSPPPLPDDRAAPLQDIEGLRYRRWERGRLAMELTADRLEITARSFFSLRIRSIHQALLHNVHITLHHGSGVNPAPPSLAEGFAGIQQAATGGGNSQTTQRGQKIRLSRGVIAPFALTVRRDGDGETLLLFTARYGEMEPAEKKTRFSDATLTDPRSGKTIRSRTVYWDEARKTFQIPGNYLAESPKGQGKGTGLEVGLDFSLSPMS